MKDIFTAEWWSWDGWVRRVEGAEMKAKTQETILGGGGGEERIMETQ